MKGSTDAHGLTSEKLRCMSMYVLKIENFMKPYGITGKKLDKMIDEHFVSPLITINMRMKSSLKSFKQHASELYESMIEME
jgi:hypothetical protein